MATNTKVRTRKIRYDRIVLCLLVITFFTILIIWLCTSKNKEEKISVTMEDLSNRSISEVVEYAKVHNLVLNTRYEYSDTIEKDNIISQSIKAHTVISPNDELSVVISKGKLDKEKLASSKINELGRVPVMMYHGIVNKKDSETSYIGGNVDKDGYNRTSESFRRDLEFYYENGYRMIRAIDYVNGNIDVEYGKSPIVITFDDGNANNILVDGLDDDGNIIINKDSAVGILEEFKHKYKDYNVTATFFVNGGIFNQSEYNDKILEWLVNNGYDVGNHTRTHVNFSNVSTVRSEEEVGYIYDLLDSKIPSKYVNLVALPFGSPYKNTHENFSHILKCTYNDKEYTTISTFRVGWMPDYSPFSVEFNKNFIMRVRAYDNNGTDFDIDSTFRMLDKNRYISDGDVNTITISESNKDKLISTDRQVITY